MKKLLYVLVPSLVVVLVLSLTSLARSKTKSHPPSKYQRVLLTKDNTLVLNSEVTEASVAELEKEAAKLDSQGKSDYPIYLYMDTPGGDVEAGLNLITYLNGLNRPVHTITSFAASMGFQVVENLQNRYMTRYGILMAHRATGSFSGQFGPGQTQVKSRYDFWVRRLQIMDEHTVGRSHGKQTVSKFEHKYANEMWLTAKDAVNEGFADSIVDVRCGPSLSGTSEKSVDLGFLVIKATYSNCPLVETVQSQEANLFTNKGMVSLEKFNKLHGRFTRTCTKHSKHLCALRGATPEKIKKVLKKNKLTMDHDYYKIYLGKQKNASNTF